MTEWVSSVPRAFRRSGYGDHGSSLRHRGEQGVPQWHVAARGGGEYRDNPGRGWSLRFTASAVCSVSDTPATLLACINRTSSCFPAFETARFFCVNTLAPGHESLSNLFGGKTSMDERFSSGRWVVGRTGVPVLEDALVSFESEITHARDEGTHRVLFGRVIGIYAKESQEALFYCARRYVTIGNVT